MTTFVFNAYGNTLTITAEDIAKVRAEKANKLFLEDGLSDLSEAYGIANKELLWNEKFKDGIWEEATNVPNTYKWVEGYFFD